MLYCLYFVSSFLLSTFYLLLNFYIVQKKVECSETQMLLSALAQSDTTQFQQFQLQLPHESTHQLISPLAHLGVVPTQPLSRGRLSFLDWREKEKNPAYSNSGNASPTPHCRNDRLTGRFKIPYLRLPNAVGEERYLSCLSLCCTEYRVPPAHPLHRPCTRD